MDLRFQDQSTFFRTTVVFFVFFDTKMMEGIIVYKKLKSRRSMMYVCGN
jgi:hypothetical protein